MSIRENTASLEEILATVNALPDAGSGGGGGSSVVRSTTGMPIEHNVTAKTIKITGAETSGLTHLFLDANLAPLGIYANAAGHYLVNLDLDIVNGTVDWTIMYYVISTNTYVQTVYIRGINATITVDESSDTITVDYSAETDTALTKSQYEAGAQAWIYTAIYEN